MIARTLLLVVVGLLACGVIGAVLAMLGIHLAPVGIALCALSGVLYASPRLRRLTR